METGSWRRSEEKGSEKEEGGGNKEEGNGKKEKGRIIVEGG